MKSILSIIIGIILFSTTVSSQCTIDPSLTEVGFYPSPDSLDCIQRTVNYSVDIQFVTPASFDTFGTTLTIDTIAISSLTGLPNGITYACNPSSCKIIGGQNGCINVSGTTNDTAGQYLLNVIAEVTVTVPLLGQIKQSVDLASLGIVYYLTVIEQGAGCHEVPGASVSGKILSETGVEISSVTVAATGSSSPTDLTDTSGNYSLLFNPGDSATVTPSKSNDISTNNGVTTIDILLVRRHLLAIQALNTPYQIIAADVNGDGGVTTIDILFIRSVILQINTTFPNGKLWAFVPDDYVFQDMQNPFPFPGERTYNNLNSDMTEQNFIGMKLGDVNNDWNPNIAKRGAVSEVRFTMDEQHVSQGQEIIVPVKVKDFSNVTGYQFTLSWDAEVLELVDVSNKSIDGYYGMQRHQEGFLTTSWDDNMAKGVTLNDDETAFELKFRVIGEQGTSSEIKINSARTVSEAYNENLDLLEIRSRDGMVKVSDEEAIINLQIQPNPFSNSTIISFSISSDEHVSIIIYDMMGKEVKRIAGNFSTGEHRVEWTGKDDKENHLSGGLYHARLTAGNNETGLKVLLIK